MSFDWSKHKGGSGDFVKFESIGDKVSGQIVAIREHTFSPEKGPVVLLDILPTNAEETMTLACDKVDLRIKIADLEPQVTDMLAVEFVNTEKTPNGTKKVFAVRHRRGSRPLLDEKDPELERLLAEEAEIERRSRERRPSVDEFPEPREEFSSDPF